MDFFKKQMKETIESPLKQAQEKLEEPVKKVTEAVNQGLDVVAVAGKTAIGTTIKIADEQRTRAQEILDVGKAHYQSTEDLVFSALRAGVDTAIAHSEVSQAVLATGLVLAIPTTRRLLYRMTFGNLRSEEAMLKSCERRAGSLKELLEIESKELQKLEERIASARQEFESGRSKLYSAASQLKSLESKLSKAEVHADTLIQDLRRLKNEEALSMRAEMAQASAAAKRQRTAVERRMKEIINLGLPI